MVDKRKAEGRLAEVGGQDGPIDAAEHHVGWADSRDMELPMGCGYHARRIAARALDGALPDRDAELLDLGRGTGICRQLVPQDAGRPSAVPEGRHDGVIPAGRFRKRHLGPEAIGGPIALARQGGAVAILNNTGPCPGKDRVSYIGPRDAADIRRIARIEDRNSLDSLEGQRELIVGRRCGGGA